MTREEYKKRGKGVVRDGEVVHVPLHLMDGVQQALARPSVKLTDAHGHPAGFVQGYVFPTRDAATEQRDEAREDAYERRRGVLAASWCVR
jgi:hypothetical protein